MVQEFFLKCRKDHGDIDIKTGICHQSLRTCAKVFIHVCEVEAAKHGKQSNMWTRLEYSK